MATKQMWKVYQLNTGLFLAHLLENPADEAEDGTIAIISGWAGADITGLFVSKHITFNRKDVIMTLEQECS